MNRLLCSLNRSIIHEIQTKSIYGAASTRNFKCAATDFCQHKSKTAANDLNAQKKKFQTSPKITLISLNHAVSVTSLEEAHKLAKRRDLHLVQLEERDSKTQRPTYKLVTAAEILSEELEEHKNTSTSMGKDKRSEKSLTIGSRITEHDLGARLKHISKWLSKQHEIRVLIQGTSDDMSNSEKIAKTIEQSIKEPQVIGKIVQKRTKGSVIKFNILPVAEALTNAAPNETAKQTA